MRFRIAALLALLCALTLSATAFGAAPTGNKAFCFDGPSEGTQYGGSCTALSPNRFYLDTNGADPDGEYAGIAIQNDYPAGTALSSINRLSFQYTGTAPYGGAPRISLGVDESGDGSGYDAFAFVAAETCNDGFGKVDVINDATCQIDYKGAAYSNWSTFLTAFPLAEVGYDYTFIVADAPGEWTIYNAQLGAKSRGGK